MIKKILDKRYERKNKELLTLELSEISEIAEGLFRRIDERINNLRELERNIDLKIEVLRELISKAENVENNVNLLRSQNYREIHILSEKGLNIDEIADFFDMPKGEVELILNVFKS
jgi:hypothetical protein